MTSTNTLHKCSKLYNEHLAGRLTIPTTISYNQQHVYGNITVINRDGIDHDVFPLTKQKCCIGRDLGCDIRIQRPTVSKEHAIISVDDNKVYLQNLSENGLLLCGKFIGKTNPDTRQDMNKIVLNDGDIFTISGRSFRFNYPKITMKPIHTSLQYQKSPINTTLSKIVDENALPTFNSPNRTPKKELLKEALNTLLPYATPKQSKNTQDISILSPFKPHDQSNISNDSTIDYDLILFSPNTKNESKKRKISLSSPSQSKRIMSRFKITDISIHTEQSNTINDTTRPPLGLPFLTPQKPKKKITSELQDLINKNTIISSPSLIKTSNLIDNRIDNESETTERTMTISNSHSICSTTKTHKLDVNHHILSINDPNTNELVTPNSPRMSSRLNKLSTNEEYNITIASPLIFEESNGNTLESTFHSLVSPTKSPPIAKRTRRHNIITESLDSIIAASPIIGRRITKRK